VRTFVGSRSASVDETFSDKAEDATANGFPPVQSYVMNLTARAMDEPPILDFDKHINWTASADGLVGGILPVVSFTFHVSPNSPYLPSAVANRSASRLWSMVAAPVPDMEGGREQSVWFRFVQLECASNYTPPCKARKKRSISRLAPPDC
jgi:hypothetical protein